MNTPTLKTMMVEVIDHEETGFQARQYRESKGVSLRRVAELMEFSAPYVSDLELGRRKWDQEKLEKFAWACCNPNAKP